MSCRPMLTVVLERLLEMKARPAEVTRWSDDWFGAQSVFVYETFLYVVATLIREQGFHVIRSVFETHYMLPETERHGESFGRFDRFQGHSRSSFDRVDRAERTTLPERRSGVVQTSSNQN